MIDINKLVSPLEVRFFKYLELPLYQMILYGYWKRGIKPVSEEEILKKI